MNIKVWSYFCSPLKKELFQKYYQCSLPSIVSSHSLESNPVRHLLPFLQWNKLPKDSMESAVNHQSYFIWLSVSPSLAYSAAHSSTLAFWTVLFLLLDADRPYLLSWLLPLHADTVMPADPRNQSYIFSFVPSLTVLVIISNFMLASQQVSPALISLQNFRLIKLTAFPKAVLGHLTASNSAFQTWMPDFPLCFAYNLPQLS